MTLSVNTNQSALIALQNLTTTSDMLSKTESVISSGLKISTAKENAAVYSIAQHQRADQNALTAVSDSLNRAASIADVAASAGGSISDLLNTMKQKVTAAMDPSYDATSRAALDTDFKSLVQQMARQIAGASFNGANMLDGTQGAGLNFLANVNATQSLTLNTQNLSFGGSINTLLATDTVSTPTIAAAVMTRLNATIDGVNLALAKLGAQSAGIDQHKVFLSKLSDAITTGIGHLVDADMPAESARLQALQVKQQLGTQALSIANQAPQSILSLFK